MSKEDVTGQKFGSLTAKAYSHTINRISYWVFQCDCGNTHVARLAITKHNAKKAESPKSPSCGCVHKEAIGNRARKLSPSDVLDIKRLYATGNFTHKALAEMFAVTRSNIGRILKST